MAMKIDEAEQYLIALKHCETCESNDANDCKSCEYHQKGSSAKCYDAIDVGVDIIHKYKKIKQIFKDIEECPLVEDNALNEIKEIIKDGNVK